MSSHPAIPEEKKETAVHSVTDGILGGLQQQAAQGNVGDLLRAITGGSVAGPTNPVVGGVVQQVTGTLIHRLGLSESAAGSLAAAVVPLVLERLFGMATDPADSRVDVGQILAKATGNAQAGQIDWTGIRPDADGKLAMDDVLRAAGGLFGKDNKKEGGLGGMLGGLFGK